MSEVFRQTLREGNNDSRAHENLQKEARTGQTARARRPYKVRMTRCGL